MISAFGEAIRRLWHCLIILLIQSAAGRQIAGLRRHCGCKVYNSRNLWTSLVALMWFYFRYITKTAVAWLTASHRSIPARVSFISPNAMRRVTKNLRSKLYSSLHSKVSLRQNMISSSERCACDGWLIKNPRELLRKTMEKVAFDRKPWENSVKIAFAVAWRWSLRSLINRLGWMLSDIG